MKTLKQLGLDGYTTANFADHRSAATLKLDWPAKYIVCCGWMDLHEDSDNLGSDKDPLFLVEPLYWDPKAYFVYKSCHRGKAYSVLSRADFKKRKTVEGIRYTERGFYFDATIYHGLVTKEIATNLCDPAYEKSQDYRSWAVGCMRKVSPKLVWTFGESSVLKK